LIFYFYEWEFTTQLRKFKILILLFIKRKIRMDQELSVATKGPTHRCVSLFDGTCRSGFHLKLYFKIEFSGTMLLLDWLNIEEEWRGLTECWCVQLAPPECHAFRRWDLKITQAHEPPYTVLHNNTLEPSACGCQHHQRFSIQKFSNLCPNIFFEPSRSMFTNTVFRQE